MPKRMRRETSYAGPKKKFCQSTSSLKDPKAAILLQELQKVINKK
jgi:hypothetical protein